MVSEARPVCCLILNVETRAPVALAAKSARRLAPESRRRPAAVSRVISRPEGQVSGLRSRRIGAVGPGARLGGLTVRVMIFAWTYCPSSSPIKKDGRPDGQEVKKATYSAADGDEEAETDGERCCAYQTTTAISEALTIGANSQFAVKTSLRRPGSGQSAVMQGRRRGGRLGMYSKSAARHRMRHRCHAPESIPVIASTMDVSR